MLLRSENILWKVLSKVRSNGARERYVVTYISESNKGSLRYRQLRIFKFIAMLHGIEVHAKANRIFLNGNELDYRGDNLAMKYKGKIYYIHEV